MDFFAQETFPDQLAGMCDISADLVITCGKKSLFYAYKKFCQDFYSGTHVRLPTFTEQIHELGITDIGRKRFRPYSSQTISVSLTFEIVAEQYHSLYDVETPPWYCQTDPLTFYRKYHRE
jgi:hypothetical protein